MSFGRIAILSAVIAASAPVYAQVPDCSLQQNLGRDECLALPPPQEATNIIFGIAPVLAGLGAVAAVAAVASGGGGEAAGTPSTSPTD
jgi:hypothetical protein